MKSDLEKSKEELIAEIKVLRARIEERSLALERECLDRDQNAEALRMAKVIVDNSPAILFRRVAGDDPRLVYVSDNIRQLGYTAEEFMSGKITFRDIVHPDDVERVRAGNRRLRRKGCGRIYPGVSDI